MRLITIATIGFLWFGSDAHSGDDNLFADLIPTSYSIEIVGFEESERCKSHLDPFRPRDALDYNVIITGQIEIGIVDALANKISGYSSTRKHFAPCIIYLDSRGGNVAEAIRLGRYIRDHQLWTIVARDSECLSACVFALSGGVIRVAAGTVGIHSIYAPEFLGSGRFAEASSLLADVDVEIRRFLHDMRVSSNLIDLTYSVQHNEIRVLNFDELTEANLMGIDPAYRQVMPGW